MADFMINKLGRLKYVDTACGAITVNNSIVSASSTTGDTRIANSPIQKILNGHLHSELSRALEYNSLIKMVRKPVKF